MADYWIYNGVELPPIPEHVADKFPYLFIGRLINESSNTDTYQLFGYDKPLIFTDNFKGYTNCFYAPSGSNVCYMWLTITDGIAVFDRYYEYESTGTTIIFDKNTNVDYHLSREFIWTNVDLYYDDKNIYMAASEPVNPDFWAVRLEYGTLNLIAKSIRQKNKSAVKYKPSDMCNAIKELPEGVPIKYQEYVNYAKQNLYSGKYNNLMILEYDDFISVSFMMDDFMIYMYNQTTTEITAIGWVTCVCTKSTNEWTMHDYTTQANSSENYAKHIVYSSCYIYYGDTVLFPVSVNNFIKVTDISFNDNTNSITVTTETNHIEQLTLNYDDSGELVAITDSSGNITIVSGVS